MLGSSLGLGMRASIQFTNDTFAYWFDSDVHAYGEPEMPIVGRLFVDGWRISLGSGTNKWLYSQDWYVFSHEGCLALMPAAQYCRWLDSGRYDPSLLLWHVDSFSTSDPLMPMSVGVLFAGRPLNCRLHDRRNGPEGRRLLTYHVRAKDSGDVEQLDLMNTANLPSLFAGEIPTALGEAHPSNGVLEVHEDDIVLYDLLAAHAKELNVATSLPPSEIRVIPVKKWHWGEPTPPGDSLEAAPEE